MQVDRTPGTLGLAARHRSPRRSWRASSAPPSSARCSAWRSPPLIGGAASPRHRRLLARGVLVLLGAATLALVLHLAGDDFGYRYAWLYSAAELPLYLKVANLWGGEEGTLLLMATLLALAACRLVDADGWSGAGALLLSGPSRSAR